MAMPYGATVLEHFRRPRNQRQLERPTVSSEGYNPLCGDRVRMELEVEASTIRAAAFTANACAICTASASLLTERVNGGSVDDARRLTDDEIVEALGADLPSARRTCAILPLRTLRDALSGVQPST
jgi:nitrogen fixation NifU-like protein